MAAGAQMELNPETGALTVTNVATQPMRLTNVRRQE